LLYFDVKICLKPLNSSSLKAEVVTIGAMKVSVAFKGTGVAAIVVIMLVAVAKLDVIVAKTTAVTTTTVTDEVAMEKVLAAASSGFVKMGYFSSNKKLIAIALAVQLEL
jgi:hypothetical protein